MAGGEALKEQSGGWSDGLCCGCVGAGQGRRWGCGRAKNGRGVSLTPVYHRLTSFPEHTCSSAGSLPVLGAPSRSRLLQYITCHRHATEAISVS